ncbi:MAG: LamG domain-containing protein [Patescibacteria group bacterium]
MKIFKILNKNKKKWWAVFLVFFLIANCAQASFTNLSGNSLNKGLVGSWPLDRQSTGTNNYFGYADFNSSTDEITLPAMSLVNGSYNFSLSYWLKAENIPTVDDWTYADSPISFGGDGTGFMTFADGGSNPNRLSFRANFASVGWTSPVESGQLSNNVWYHIVVTFNTSSGWKMYQDGVLVDSNTMLNTFSGATVNNKIGKSDGGTDRSFDGKITDVRLYNTTLSAADVLTLSYVSNIAASVVQSNLFAWWKLNYDSDDYSGNSRNGTNTGVTITIPMTDGYSYDKTPYSNDITISSGGATDRFGKSYGSTDFNGTSNYLEVPSSSSIDIRRTISFSFWFYVDTLPSAWSALFSKMDSSGSVGSRTYAVFLNTNGYLHLTSADATGQETADTVAGSIQTGRWYHYMAVIDRNSGTLKSYLNGVQAASGTVRTTDTVSNSEPLNIGSHRGSTYNYFDGRMEDVLLYDRALTANDVLSLYDSYNQKVSAGNLNKGLAGHWPLDSESNKGSYGYDISTAVYNSNFSIASQDTSPREINFNTDGTRMFMLGFTGVDVNEYHCTTGFDVSTCTYDSVFSVSTQEIYPQGLAFNPDGTKMFVIGYSGDDVNEYHCTVGFDVSTCSYNSVYSVSSYETNPSGIDFNTDGTKMFIVGYDGDAVDEYHCSTGFLVSTCAYDSTYSVASQEIAPYSVVFNIDGTKMFIGGNNSGYVREYHLSTGFDVSTASYDSSLNVSSYDTTPLGIAFNTNGTKMFVSGFAGQDINEFDLDTSSVIMADKTPNSNDGITFDGPTLIIDRFGKTDGAMSFSGGVTSGDYISLGSSHVIDLTSATVSFWAKRDVLVTTQDGTNTAGALRILYGGTSYKFLDQWVNDTYFQFQGERDVNSEYWANITSSVVADTNWHHFVITANNNVFTLYIDGVYQGVDNDSSAGYTSNTCTISDIAKGYTVANSSYGSYFDGSLSDMRFYNRPLSAAEVSTLYSSYKPKISAGNLNKGLVGFWPLNSQSQKSSTVYADKTPNSNDGTATNGPALTTGPTGKVNDALSFNGSNQCINIPNSTALDNQTITISAWVNPTADGNYFIFEKGSVNTQYSFFFEGAYLRFRTMGAASYDLAIAKTTAGITNGEWHHVAATFDGTTKTIYVDGAYATSMTWANTISTNTWGSIIGCYGGTTPSYFLNGKISGVRVYNRALSAEEINLLYQTKQ